eukprot:gnl/TRDRNA2_/TRDRNA2_154863_c0_seq2.p1 gnl/TRDRNA2_/TRDRNA2_154863_c0~~gnl/TRDRNA2_/TRDRNA2_154863_c0_seq2.p1  ORF type:complete len:409 (+),score=69.24 gnl/TRDRNA2_/TRDRNA2_154863_c0_seq2:174-1229(+)
MSTCGRMYFMHGIVTALMLGVLVGTFAVLIRSALIDPLDNSADTIVQLWSMPHKQRDMSAGMWLGRLQRSAVTPWLPRRPLRGSTAVIRASSWEKASQSLCVAGAEVGATAALVGRSRQLDTVMENPAALSAIGSALCSAGIALRFDRMAPDALEDAARELLAAGSVAKPTLLVGASDGLKKAGMALTVASTMLSKAVEAPNEVLSDRYRNLAEVSVAQDAAAALDSAAQATGDAANFVANSLSTSVGEGVPKKLDATDSIFNELEAELLKIEGAGVQIPALKKLTKALKKSVDQERSEYAKVQSSSPSESEDGQVTGVAPSRLHTAAAELSSAAAALADTKFPSNPSSRP